MTDGTTSRRSFLKGLLAAPAAAYLITHGKFEDGKPVVTKLPEPVKPKVGPAARKTVAPSHDAGFVVELYQETEAIPYSADGLTIHFIAGLHSLHAKAIVPYGGFEDWEVVLDTAGNEYVFITTLIESSREYPGMMELQAMSHEEITHDGSFDAFVRRAA